MALTVRRRGDNGLSAWPGYVDALSTLLMVIIFVLLVFVLAQAFLSVALSGRDKQLDRVNRQLAEVSDMLSLERGRGADLQQSIAQLNRELAVASTARDSLSQQLAALQSQAERATADRDTLRSERDRLAQQLADAALQTRSSAARVQQLQQDLTASGSRTDAAKQETATVATQLAEARRQLGDTTSRLADAQAQLAEMQRQIAELDKTVQVNKETIATKLSDLAKLTSQLTDARTQLAEMQRQIAELDKTVQVDKETIAARLSDLAKLTEENRALAALRDSLEKQAQDAAARAVTDQQRLDAVTTLLAEEKRLGSSARARVALLSQQVDELKGQLTSIAKALELAQTQGQDKDTQIANLSQKLNTALAAKVEELQRYRSEFFGKLRDVLASHPGIQIVGDRFVFQSEVLFPLGSADLTQAGQNELTALAVTIKDIAKEIPPDIKWILRVDGHTDRQPIKGAGAFASNWELSAARAITVVKLLISEGVPPEHLAATGFADNQPLDPADTPEAYARDRRIELRLTDR
jgi:chemotaxis protein MotB